jgi:anti-anti-sigma factor
MYDPTEEFQLRISIKCTDGIPVIALAGECDAFTAAFTHAAIGSLITEGYKGIVIEISELKFMDVAGFHALDDCCRQMTEAGGKLLLVNPGEFVEEIYDILREKESCQVVKSVDEAMSALAPTANA